LDRIIHNPTLSEAGRAALVRNAKPPGSDNAKIMYFAHLHHAAQKRVRHLAAGINIAASEFQSVH
jgi:hypothetical protein